MGEKRIWEMPSSSWAQDDDLKQFYLLDPKTGEPQANQRGLEILAGARSHGAGDVRCGKFYPKEFAYCPFCGKGLVPADYASTDWVPPYGRGNGLRLIPKGKNANATPLVREDPKPREWEEMEALPLPRPQGDYEFIVGSLGTSAPVLIAFDRVGGYVDYFSPAEEKWMPLDSATGRRAQESQSPLPNWSWSAAFLQGKPGFAVPTREGPAWIAIEWPDNKYTLVFGRGGSIGGAVAFENRIFAPVLAERGISILDFDVSSSKWKPAGEPARGWAPGPGKSNFFSVPIIDESRRWIQWVGIEGLLTFDAANNESSWRPWETDAFPCKAMTELGPPYRDFKGYFWQICYDEHDGGFRYFKLSGNESDRQNVDGARFSSGVSCFSKPYDLWKEPWGKVPERLEEARDFRIPLLCLNEDSKATLLAVFEPRVISQILDIVKDPEKTHCVFFRIEFPNFPSVNFRMRNAFNTEAPWELRVFVYRQCLFVHSLKEGVCRMWRLE